MLLEEALIIERETQGAVLWNQLVPEADPRVTQRLNGEAIPLLTHRSRSSDKKNKKPFSQWVFEAMEYEKQFLDQRQGQRTDKIDKTNKTLRENSHEVKGRSDTCLTTEFEVGSEWKYRKGKKVMLEGVFELIKAMDDWLPVYLAAALTLYPREKQRWIFTLTQKEIRAYAQAAHPPFFYEESMV